MEKTNIFMFWIGNDKFKKSLLDKIDHLTNRFKNVSIHIGPNKKDHQYLMNNFEFYRINFNIKRYSFCSDLYRVWKLSNNKGLYLDASIILNEDRFEEFLGLIKGKENVFVKENGYLIWNGLLYTSNNVLFENILFFYKNYYKFANFFTGPMIMSMHVNRFLSDNGILFLDARDIDYFSDDSYFKYNGFGSWGKKSNVDFDSPIFSGAHYYFHRNAICFSKFSYDKKIYSFIRWWIKNYFVIFYPYIKIKNYCLDKKMEKK